MSNNSDAKPKKDNLVLGGNTPPPLTGAVLGGIEGLKNKIKQRRNNRSDLIAALELIRKVNLKKLIVESLHELMSHKS